jgi:hypothetical protein
MAAATRSMSPASRQWRHEESLPAPLTLNYKVLCDMLSPGSTPSLAAPAAARRPEHLRAGGDGP